MPVLAAALLTQQSETRYAFRDPLPIPVEDFLHTRDAVKAWTAELNGHPVGHVRRMGPARDFQQRIFSTGSARGRIAAIQASWPG